MKIVITGGHHTSALPVVEELKNRFPDVQIFWVGHKYSARGDKNPTLEFREITELGIPFFNLHAGKIYRTFNPVRILKIPFGFLQALYLLLKLRPNIVLSFGGYLAAPVVLAAWVLRIPSLTHEQTVKAGYANRFISHFVKKILISWPDSTKYYPANKVVFTGLPLRKEIFSVSTNNFGVSNELPVIYITTGKIGSHKINSVVLGALESLLTYCNVIHQCGDNSIYKDYEVLSAKYEEIKSRVPGKYFPRKFVMRDEIGEVFYKASLVVSRSGAHTMMELLALEKPAILIPIPWVSHNEQYENAKVLENSGLAIIIKEKDLTSDFLDQSIKKILQNLNSMKLKDNAYGTYKNVIIKNSAEIIVNEVAQLYQKTN